MAISRVDAVSTTKIPTANTPAMIGRRGGLESVGGNARSSISLAPTPLGVPPCPDRGDHRVAMRQNFIISAQYRANDTGSKERWRSGMWTHFYASAQANTLRKG